MLFTEERVRYVRGLRVFCHVDKRFEYFSSKNHRRSEIYMDFMPMKSELLQAVQLSWPSRRRFM